MDLKISLRSQLFALKEMIVISIVYFGLLYLLYLNTDIEGFKILFLGTFVFYFIIVLLPVVVLHINYLHNAYKDIKVEENKLTVNNKIMYTAMDINQINIYATAQHINDVTGAFTPPYAMCYYYIEINLKSRKNIILSSLIDYKMDQIIKNKFKTIKIIEHPSTFAMLLINKQKDENHEC